MTENLLNDLASKAADAVAIKFDRAGRVLVTRDYSMEKHMKGWDEEDENVATHEFEDGSTFVVSTKSDGSVYVSVNGSKPAKLKTGQAYAMGLLIQHAALGAENGQ